MSRLVFKQQIWKLAFRVILVSVNVFVLLLCLGVFVTGLLTRLSEQTYLVVTGEASLTEASLSAAAVGVCAALLAIVGILGSFILKSILGRVVVSVYAFVLLFLIVTEVAAGVSALHYRSSLEDEEFRTSTIRSLNHTYSKSNDTNEWDHFQEKYSCCGAENYTDFFSIFYEDVVPNSCCTHAAKSKGRCSHGNKSVTSDDLKDIHTKPCLDVIVPELKEMLLNLAIIIIVLSALQTSGVVFSTVAIYLAVREDEQKAQSYQKLHRQTSNLYTT